MFKIGDLVAYAANGIYEVIDVRKESVLGAVCSYYVLGDFRDRSESLVFVPVDNEILTSNMRYLMTAAEARSVIDSVEDIEPAPWTPDARVRNDAFKAAMVSGDYRAVIAIMKSIWQKGKERELIGKKNYQTDETLLKKAERLLYTEMALALGVTASEIREMVENIEK